MFEEYFKKNDSIVIAKDRVHCFEVLNECVKAGYYFRGVSNKNYHLLTTLDRYGAPLKKHRELFLMREFRRRIHHYLRVEHMPSSTFELLSLMQHYGVPTRLLDFTKSPYVALYFAVRNILEEKDATVWAIMPHNMHIMSYRKLKDAGFPYDLRTDVYFSQEFVHENYFQEAFMRNKYGVIMQLQPEIMNERLSLQQGVFFISDGIAVNRSDDPVKNIGEFKNFEETLIDLLNEVQNGFGQESTDPSVIKLVIPSALKKGIVKELDLMNLNASTLFPGLEGFYNVSESIYPLIG